MAHVPANRPEAAADDLAPGAGERRLAVEVGPIAMHEVPLTDAVASLADAAGGVPVVVDVRGLELAGVDRATPVTLTTGRTNLEAALRQVSRQAGSGFVDLGVGVSDGVVWLTTADRLRSVGWFVTRSYDVGRHAEALASYAGDEDEASREDALDHLFEQVEAIARHSSGIAWDRPELPLTIERFGRLLIVRGPLVAHQHVEAHLRGVLDVRDAAGG